MSENGRDTGIGRRDAVKQLSAVGIGIGAFGTGTAMSQDGGKEIPYDDFQLPYPNKSVTRFGDGLREVTTHPELLALSWEATERHLQSSLDGSRLNGAMDYLKDLRDDYPVKRASTGGDTVIRLAPGAKTEPIFPPKNDEVARRRHRDVVSAFAGGEELGSNWEPSQHKEITQVLVDTADGYVYDYPIVQGSDDPDFFGDKGKNEVGSLCDQLDLGPLNGFKDKACGVIAGALDVFASNYTHYHDPSIGSIPLGPFGKVKIPAGLGKAPAAGNAFFYTADSANDGKKLGWSLHYLQDTAVPLHTGLGIEQAGLEVTLTGVSKDPKYWIHYGFEGLVAEYWDQNPGFSGDTKSLKKIMADSDTAGYVYPKFAIQNMASTATKYADDVYYEILENETEDSDYPDWGFFTKYNVYKDLSNCFAELGYLGRAFVEKYDD